MLIVVDGYNVTRRDPATRSLSLEAQRDALVARLRTRGARLLGAGRIVVVFDGADGTGVAREAAWPVEVVYARDGTADDVLVAMVAAETGSVVVVSDDRELAERARAHGGARVQVRAAATCFEAAAPARRSRRPIARDGGLPAGANRITEELKQLWLDDEE